MKMRSHNQTTTKTNFTLSPDLSSATNLFFLLSFKTSQKSCHYMLFHNLTFNPLLNLLLSGSLLPQTLPWKLLFDKIRNNRPLVKSKRHLSDLLIFLGNLTEISSL